MGCFNVNWLQLGTYRPCISNRNWFHFEPMLENYTGDNCLAGVLRRREEQNKSASQFFQALFPSYWDPFGTILLVSKSTVLIIT